jgi:Rrf2 family iron-sulfur cluster assembly transcriptional regulator
VKLTTKGRYAVNAVLDLALNAHEGPVKLVQISDRQGISLSYLEQLFAKLRRNELVTSFRGPGGGYQLGKSIHHISIADIVLAVNESIDATRCKTRGDCQQGETCLTHHLWMDLSAQLEEFLSGITLADLIHRHTDREETRVALQAYANQQGHGMDAPAAP